MNDCTWCCTMMWMAVIGAAALIFNWLLGPKAINLSGKHVLITGGSSGIGEACAVACVSQGAKVTILARNAQQLNEACQRILASSKNPGALLSGEKSVNCVSADVSDADKMKAAVASAEAFHGEVRHNSTMGQKRYQDRLWKRKHSR
eukprot:1188816-Prorocentrum_minimum.AAC.2